MAGTRVRVVTDLDEIESLAKAWDGLIRECDNDCPVYLTLEWVTTWWKCFGGRNKLNIVVVEEENRVIGIFPLMRIEYRAFFLRLRAFVVVGSENSNHIGITSPEKTDEAVEALLSYLEAELREKCSLLRLSFVHEDSAILAALRRLRPQHPCLITEERVTTIAPFVALPSSWEEYSGSLSQQRRWRLRRSLRALQEAHTVEFCKYSDDSLDRVLDILVDLHQRRWEAIGVRGTFSDPRREAFYREIARSFSKKQWLHLSYLTIGTDTVSVLLSFVYSGRLYAAVAGRDLIYSGYRVGHIHYMFLIQEAIEQGLREFDFMRGAEPYKFYWTKSAKQYMEILAVNRSFCPSLRLRLMRCIMRFQQLRAYSFREMYALYRVKKKEAAERRRMGIRKEDYLGTK